MGLKRFATTLVDSGVSGCILPDLPLEEAGAWLDVADEAAVEPILLAAPTAPTSGFLGSVNVLGGLSTVSAYSA